VDNLRETPTFKQLQREVNLKQLQINGLLAITQAINENVKSSLLFTSYQKFLHLEMQVGAMALYFQEEDTWVCVSHYGFEIQDCQPTDMPALLARYRKRTPLASFASDPFLGHFDLVIPVFHKNVALAYVFIGDLKEEDDILSNINFITTITNIIAVAIENKRLFKEQAENQALSREMDLAGQIQRSLIPASLPSTPYLTFSSVYMPHFAVGGDYYDAVILPNDEIVFCIADISGKGVSAALLMANFQAKLHALLLRGLGLEETIREINTYVLDITQGDRFITLFLAKYSAQTRLLEYVNAGHVTPFLINQKGVSMLHEGCTVLGFLPVLKLLELGSLLVPPNTFFFSYTDGLTDILNDSGESFDDQKLLTFLQEHHHEHLDKITEKLLQKVTKFRGKQAFPDDITVLTCRLG
jgi:phosphoserine phosphatase RsbU/P